MFDVGLPVKGDIIVAIWFTDHASEVLSFFLKQQQGPGWRPALALAALHDAQVEVGAAGSSQAFMPPLPAGGSLAVRGRPMPSLWTLTSLPAAPAVGPPRPGLCFPYRLC